MKLFQSTQAMRRAVAFFYLLVAIGAPILAIQAPGVPPLSLNTSLASVVDGQFVDHTAALGEGAELYKTNVLHDMSKVVASAAAEYSDGSSVLIAWFDKPVLAQGGIERFKTMIPHYESETDLWTTHFVSKSGEYIMLAEAGGLLVLIMSEDKNQAREHLIALPVLNYEINPGLGAVINQLPEGSLYLVAIFYVVIQWLMIRLLFSWAGKVRQPDAAD